MRCTVCKKENIETENNTVFGYCHSCGHTVVIEYGDARDEETEIDSLSFQKTLRIAADLRKQQRYTEALAIYEYALKSVRRRILPGEYNRNAYFDLLFVLAQIAIISDQPDAVLSAYEECRQAYETDVIHNPKPVANLNNYIKILLSASNVLRGQGKTKESFSLYQQAISEYEKVHGTIPDKKYAAGVLIRLYYTCGHRFDSEAHRSKAVALAKKFPTLIVSRMVLENAE